MRDNEEDETAIVNAEHAVRVLEGASPASEPDGGEPLGGMVAPEVPGLEGETQEEMQHLAMRHNEPVPAMPKAQAAPVPDGRSVEGEGSGGPGAEQVINAAAEFGVDRARYGAYAAKRWGPGWKINAAGRRRALAEIESFCDDPDGFADKVATELGDVT